MNAKVEEFINKMKEEQKAKELSQKKKHLISLGLVDESKTVKGIVYLDNWDGTKECKFNSTEKKYYKERFVVAPIEVTDEEYQEILKYAPLSETSLEKDTAEITNEAKTNWAGTIKTIAIIFLVVNIIGGFIVWMSLLDSSRTDDYAWIPVVVALVNSLLYFPLIMGFSRIVAASEKRLQG